MARINNLNFLLKNLKENMYNNIFLFIGITFNLTFVYCFLFLKTSILSSDRLWIAFKFDELAGNVNIFTIVSFLSGIFLTIFLSLPYIKERIREYGLLLVLGIRKKRLYLLMGMEYSIIWGITLVFGIFAGMTLSMIMYFILQYTGIYTAEIDWMKIVWSVCLKVVLLSIIYMLSAFLYLMIRLGNKNLSEFAAETSRPEKLKSMSRSVRTGLYGVFLIIFSLTVRFTINYWPVFLKRQLSKNILAFLSCIVGIYLLLTSGMAIMLWCMQKNKKYYVKNMISIYSMRFKVASYRNIIFAVILIYYVALFYVGDNVKIFPGMDKPDYGWRYPYDIVASMKSEEAVSWEKISQEDKMDFYSVPYVDIKSSNGMRYIGIPASEYGKMVSGTVNLKREQIVLCIQHSPSDAQNALEDWEGENNITFEIGNEMKVYDIAGKDVNIISIGILVMDGARVDVIVFEDNEYADIAGKLRSENVLVLQNVESKNREAVFQKLQEFKTENPQISYLTRPGAMDIENAVERISPVIYIFCGIFLVMAGLSMLCFKFFSEIPELESKYKFWSEIGMTEKQMKKELCKETRQSVWLPVMFSIFMAGIYKADIICMYGENLTYYLEGCSKISEFVWWMSRDWLCIVVVFCCVQIIYEKCMAGFLSKRIIPNEVKESNERGI